MAGWDDTRWLDTMTVKGRWELVRRSYEGRHITGTAINAYRADETPEQALAAARAFWGDPDITPETLVDPLRLRRVQRAGEPHRHQPQPLSRLAPERAAGPDLRLPRPPDELTMPNCGCNDYSRTQLLRRAAAEAGRGLPAIEPGMPLPAGTGLSRRSFISRSAGLALAVYGAASMGPRQFEEGISAASAQASGERVLVSIFLSGGADSLTMLAPKQASHPQYATLRPDLGLAEGQGADVRLDTTLRWHPSLAGLAELDAEQKVDVLPAIGYTDPNQSHFTSRHYWEVGELNPFGRWGWLGRYLDSHGAPDNPLQGLTLGWDLQPSLAARDVPIATVSQPDEYDFWTNDVGSVYDGMLDAFTDMGDPPTSDAGLSQARTAVAATGRLREQLAPFNSAITLPAGYPNTSFGRRLAWIVKLLQAGLPLKVVALESGGYDTHSNQLATLPRRPAGGGRFAARLPA